MPYDPRLDDDGVPVEQLRAARLRGRRDAATRLDRFPSANRADAAATMIEASKQRLEDLNADDDLGYEYLSGVIEMAEGELRVGEPPRSDEDEDPTPGRDLDDHEEH